MMKTRLRLQSGDHAIARARRVFLIVVCSCCGSVFVGRGIYTILQEDCLLLKRAAPVAESI